jgi:septal ring-binding cell division protein DamX
LADAFPISGSIDPKAFPYLLMDLHRNGATGSLKVEGPSYQKALYFRTGRVLFGSSNDPRDQLGAILIETGKITPEQLEDVTAKVGPGNPLAKALADTGYVSQRELSDAARAKVETILSDVIAYTSGNFEFEDGVLPKGAIDLKLSTEKLVLASVRRLTDRNFVLRHLDGLEVVLSPGADLAARLPELQPEAGGLPEQLDGKRTLKEAAAQTRLDEFEAAKVACALLFLGLVKRAPAVAPQEEVVHLADDPLFRMAGSGDDELDLGETARASIAKSPAPDFPAIPAPPAPPIPIAMAAAAAPDWRDVPAEAPFFIPDELPPTVIMPPPAEKARAPEPEPEPFHIDPEPMAAPMPEVMPATLMMPPPAMTASRSEAPGFETETPSPAAATVRPSKEDQAALDALLNAPAIPASPGPAGRRPAKADSWSPPPSRPPVRRTARGPSAMVLGGVSLVLVAAAVGAAWYLWGRSPASAGTKVATQPPVTSAPATSVPVMPATPRPMASTAVPATTLPAPVTPSPRATPLPVTPSTAPPRTTPASLAEARALLKGGDLEQAAQGFAATVKAAPKSSASVQILVACSPETVQKAVANAASPELFIIPVNYKGRDCYRLLWGLYASEANAASAVRSLPEYLRKGTTPRVVGASEIVR